jgi:hypothetical protein
MVRTWDIPERDAVIKQVLSATSLEEVKAATLRQDQWLGQHPDDLGVVDGYEVPENMKEIAELQQAEREDKVPAGQAA